MEAPKPFVLSRPESLGLVIDAEACGEYMQDIGMAPEHIRGIAISALPGTPIETQQTPDSMSAVDIEYRQHWHRSPRRDGQSLIFYPNNISLESQEDPGVQPTVIIAEGLATAANYVEGDEPVARERMEALRNVYRRAIAAPLVGIAALAATEGGLWHLNEQADAIPRPIMVIVGGIFFVGSIMAATGRAARKRLDAVQHNEAFKQWPDQKRARGSAKKYADRVRAGEVPPLAALQD